MADSTTLKTSKKRRLGACPCLTFLAEQFRLLR
jgi:hypothetical protein